MTLSDLIKRLRPVPPPPAGRKRKPKRDLSQDDWLLAIEVVRVLAGHVSIATTQLYTAVPDSRRFEASALLDFSRREAA